MKIRSYLRYLTNRLVQRFAYADSEFGAIGKGCVIGRGCRLVPQNMFLGDYVMIQDNNNFISFRGKLVVKKYSVISSSCIIVPSTHMAAPTVPFYFQAKGHYGDEDHTITINEDCWVGAGSILLPKCTLGRGCVVAAGSVVTGVVPPYAVVAGIPAKVVGLKFSLEDVIKHENSIYPEEERISEDQLKTLFDKHFQGLRPMKKCDEAEITLYHEQYPGNHIR